MQLCWHFIVAVTLGTSTSCQSFFDTLNNIVRGTGNSKGSIDCVKTGLSIHKTTQKPKCFHFRNVHGVWWLPLTLQNSEVNDTKVQNFVFRFLFLLRTHRHDQGWRRNSGGTEICESHVEHNKIADKKNRFCPTELTPGSTSLCCIVLWSFWGTLGDFCWEVPPFLVWGMVFQ